MEPTSEQELKALLEEGKITDEEYNQLLGAIRRKDKRPAETDTSRLHKSRNGFGRAALILMLSGILLPVALAVLAAVSGGGLRWVALIAGLLSVPCEMLALILGIIGWRSPAGKVAAIGVPAIGLLLILISLIVPVLAYTAAAVPHSERSAQSSVESHKAYPLDSLEGILTREAQFDPSVSFGR
jgi:hypothetical protein